MDLILVLLCPNASADCGIAARLPLAIVLIVLFLVFAWCGWFFFIRFSCRLSAFVLYLSYLRPHDHGMLFGAELFVFLVSSS